MVTILEQNKIIVDSNIQSLSQKIENIEDYILLKEYLDSSDSQNLLEKLEVSLLTCQSVYDNIEKFFIEYQENTILLYFGSKGWIKKIKDHQLDARNRLERERPRLKEEQRDKTRKLFRDLGRFQMDIANFSNNDKLTEAADYYQDALRVDGGLDELIQLSEIYKNYEAQLFMEKTEYSDLIIAKEQFTKYYKLWEFIAGEWQNVRLYVI